MTEEVRSFDSVKRSARAAVELQGQLGTPPCNPFCENENPRAHAAWKVEFMQYGAVDHSAVPA